MMERVHKIYHKGKEILITDYSYVKSEKEMISILKEAEEIILSDNKSFVFLADYSGSYALPNYMKAVYSLFNKTKHLKQRGALLGITGAKGILLNVLRSTFKLSIKAFNDRETALDFLVENHE